MSATHSDGVPVLVDAIDNTKTSTGPIKCRPETYYAQFLTEDAIQRKPSASEYWIRQGRLSSDLRTILIHNLFPLEQTPGIISLLAGKPNVSTFPFLELSFTARDAHRPTDDKSDVSVSITGPLLSQALQYGATPGINGLLSWFEKLQERVHGRKAVGEGWRISIGCGSRELVSK
ncbi:hypothetical protein V5O48_017148, partial [Marasmius crinis-equi]